MWWVAAVQAGMAMGSSYTSGTIANINANYQAKMARLNANLSDMKAEAALRQGEKQQAALMVKTAQTKASQKAGYAASGIDVHGSRSVTNVLTSTEVAGEIDRLQASANAVTDAWSNRLQAVNYRNQALLAKASRQDVGMNAFMSGAASLLGSAANGAFDNTFSDTASSNDSGDSSYWDALKTHEYIGSFKLSSDGSYSRQTSMLGNFRFPTNWGGGSALMGLARVGNN